MDCNNFYVSCERVFHPEYHLHPVVVLSNNDGCVISRSNEAKRMGIKMGQPFFQVKHLMDEGKLMVRSSNYTLYGDMSRRVMSVIRGMVPRMEVYSIDEAFIDLRGIGECRALGLEIARKVRKWTGIPVSVGLGPTKTVAKMASKFAKQYAGYQGCCAIDTDEKRWKALRLFPVGDVWGVGRRIVKMMDYYGVHTAYDLTQLSRQRVQREYGIDGVRTWLELHGTPCYDFDAAVAKKSITTSRSFKKEIDSLQELEGLVADFAAHCARKLRMQKGNAARLEVFVRTNRFHTEEKQYADSAQVTFAVPTSDARELIKGALQGLRSIYRAGVGYKQAGVTVAQIQEGGVQMQMFDQVDRMKQQKLLQAIDGIHQYHGSQMLSIATQQDSSNAANRQYTTPCYTTNPHTLVKVR